MNLAGSAREQGYFVPSTSSYLVHNSATYFTPTSKSYLKQEFSTYLATGRAPETAKPQCALKLEQKPLEQVEMPLLELEDLAPVEFDTEGSVEWSPDTSDLLQLPEPEADIDSVVVAERKKNAADLARSPKKKVHWNEPNEAVQGDASIAKFVSMGFKEYQVREAIAAVGTHEVGPVIDFIASKAEEEKQQHNQALDRRQREEQQRRDAASAQCRREEQQMTAQRQREEQQRCEAESAQRRREEQQRQQMEAQRQREAQQQTRRPPTDPRLVQAQQGLNPAIWEARWNDQYNRPYFVNHRTKVTQWKRP